MATAVQYLALAAYHFRTNVSRPGFGHVFIESANHHRSNCKRLIDYLTMRGQNVVDVNTLLQLSYTPTQTEWTNVAEALKFALQLEGVVTDRFRNVIGVCEDQSFNDYNLNNWLTKEFLYTQYDDMKWYADTTSSLLKVFVTNGYYGEFQLDVGFEDEYCD
ncbi:ferritin heavy chain-like [Atheta coriaria]|uniref:ferritin heavy chain-like n=1 Tax=Dalotia coriaria TaxID=877792 RepID=UPI0031F45A02